MEIIWTGFGSMLKGDFTLVGFTYIWMFPIYGMAVFMEPIHDKIRKWPFFLRGIIYMVIIFAVEYVSGSMLKLFTGRCPWNYGRCRYSVRGIIRLDFIPIWFVVGILFEKIHDLLLKLKIV